MIYVDANVLYNYLFDSEFADEAEKALSLSGKVTSKNAVNEAVYVSIRKLAKDRHGVSGLHELKTFVKTPEGKGVLNEAFSLMKPSQCFWGFLTRQGLNSSRKRMI